MTSSPSIPFWKSSWFLGLMGIAAGAVMWNIIPGEATPMAPRMAALITVMAVWWIFEVIPVPVTSLLPLVAMPLLGIEKMDGVASYYGKQEIFLFLGGFILAIGLQESGVHKRIALRIVSLIGSRPSRMVLGFMIATGALSMWISNTATVMVMLPIALSVVKEAGESGLSAKDMAKFATCLMIGIGHAADIGGLATYVGTPPNLAFMRIYKENFGAESLPSFTEWAMVGVPLSVLFLFCGWLILTKLFFRFSKDPLFKNEHAVRDALRALGPVRRDEMVAAGVFGLAALLWLTGSDINLGGDARIPGWRSLPFLEGKDIPDSAVAIAAAMLLFMLPSGTRKGERLLTWSAAKEVPWGVLLLFGGGFAIAGGFEKSKLSVLAGEVFEGLQIDSPLLLVCITCIIVILITEVMSNTACVNLVLPILAKAAPAMGMDPRLLLIPATFAATTGFMMPVGSPTQAIIYGTGYISIQQLIRTGIVFNLTAVALIIAVVFTLGKWVWGV